MNARIRTILLLAVAALVAVPSGGAEAKRKPKPKAKAQSLKPIDYTKVKGLSQPRFTEKDLQTDVVRLPMSDGVDIYLEITRPKAPGRYPSIMESSGYHGTLYDRSGGRILPVPKNKEGTPLGLKGYFAPRGYAIVMMDLRGTGKSQGCLDHLGPADRADIKAVIEWATSQDWSNGKLGITGHSYVGGTTNLAGATGAKGLATIVPSASLARMYDHQFQMGVPFNLQWLGPIIAYEGLSLARFQPPGTPAIPVVGGPPGDNFGNDPQDIGCGMKNSAITAGSGEYTGQEEKWHRDRDWSQDVRKANVPIFMIHGLHDEAARIGGIDWFTARGRDGGHPDDKTWIGQWDHGIGCCPNQRGIQWTYALHAWFDKWVAGRKVNTGPAVEVFMNDGEDRADAVTSRKEISTFPAWPPKATMLPLETGVTGSAGSLALGPNKAGEPGALTYAADPEGYNAGTNEPAPQSTGGVEFVSEPLTAPVTMIGEPVLELSVSVTQPQVDLITNLLVENKDGARRRLTQCAMNIALKDGINAISPAVALTEYKVKPPCFAMAHHLRPGDKLVLRTTSSDPDKVPFHAVDPQVSVFGGTDKTRLMVPVIGKPAFHLDRFNLGARGDSNAGA